MIEIRRDEEEKRNMKRLGDAVTELKKKSHYKLGGTNEDEIVPRVATKKKNERKTTTTTTTEQSTRTR